MNQFVSTTTNQQIALIITAAGRGAHLRFLEFFAASIRNSHTRRAYAGAVGEFLIWSEAVGARVDRGGGAPSK